MPWRLELGMGGEVEKMIIIGNAERKEHWTRAFKRCHSASSSGRDASRSSQKGPGGGGLNKTMGIRRKLTRVSA